jgi:hypothetical protein
MDLRDIRLENMDWNHLTEDGDQWQALVNIVKNMKFDVFTATSMKVVFWDVALCCRY